MIQDKVFEGVYPSHDTQSISVSNSDELPKMPELSLGNKEFFGCSSVRSTNISKKIEETESNFKSFISSSGQVVVLEKKSIELPQVSWISDESYGININHLIDKIEAQDRFHIDVDVVGAKLRPKKTLWVEKWRPQNFLELVGNEKNNRRVMRWLRQWSPVVFGEILPEDPVINRFKQIRGQEKKVNSVEIDKDPFQRPDKKIILIHGPPGIGKTSVAHVVAKQAGYSVVEINASDERAGTRVKEKICNCLFNQTLEGAPVCMIVDEIDGSIENGFVKTLVDIIRSDIKATQNFLLRNVTGGCKQRKTKHSGKILTRPVIAICNNLYSSALEEFRQHCYIVTFVPPSNISLMDKLEYICKEEGINIKKSVLNQIVYLSQGDVRNSLNNLQFMSSNGDIESVDGKNKDITIPWYKLCNRLFKKDPNKDPKFEMHDLLGDIERNSSYEKLIDGCFQLFPQMKYFDTHMSKPARISDWLYFNDLMAKSLFEYNGELLRYCPIAILIFYKLFSDIANRTEVFIKSTEHGIRETIKANFNMAASILNNLAPIYKIFANKKSLILEYLPHLNTMLTSDFDRIKNNALKNKFLENIIAHLDQFNLTLEEQKDQNLNNVICFNPPFNDLINIENKIKGHASKSHQLHVLSAKIQELKLQKISDEIIQRAKNSEKIKNAPTTSVEYFKNQYKILNNIDSAVNKTNGSSSGDKKNSLRVWVKYKEGFSNAVRKNMTWETLWE